VNELTTPARALSMAHVLLPSMCFALVTKHDDMCDMIWRNPEKQRREYMRRGLLLMHILYLVHTSTTDGQPAPNGRRPAMVALDLATQYMNRHRFNHWW
jgi:hypothetical protein